jgi:DNA-binding transcriptional LysR family regulator
MDLRQLRYFVAVSDEGGIRAAARRLYISQPQISQAILRLESELGVELLRRSSQGVELTPEGHELLQHSREILERVGTARAAVQRLSEQRSSTLQVGVLAGVLSAGELLAPILAAFGQAHPEVTLQLKELSFNEQLVAILNGSVDVAIVRTPIAHRELDLTPIAQEPRVLMVGAAHELATEQRVQVEDILHFPTLPLDSTTEWADYWQLNDFRGARNCGTEVAPVKTVPEAQFALATHNLLVSSPAALQRLALNPLVRVIELVGATPSVIVVARRRGDTRPAVRQFVEQARSTAEREIKLLPGGALPT